MAVYFCNIIQDNKSHVITNPRQLSITNLIYFCNIIDSYRWLVESLCQSQKSHCVECYTVRFCHPKDIKPETYLKHEKFHQLHECEKGNCFLNPVPDGLLSRVQQCHVFPRKLTPAQEIFNKVSIESSRYARLMRNSSGNNNTNNNKYNKKMTIKVLFQHCSWGNINLGLIMKFSRCSSSDHEQKFS